MLATQIDPATGLPTAPMTLTPTFQLAPGGGYYTINGQSQATEYRPIEPLATVMQHGLSADLFNLPNKRTVLQRETLLFNDSQPSPAGNQIEELQSPRIWRFGARINF